MKNLKISLFLGTMLFVISVFAQADKAEWKEMKDYHSVMAATFHPSEDGNFAPIREKSGELAKKATAWSKSVYPAGYEKAKIAPVLLKLAAESKTLDAKIKAGATDAEIKKLLATLHDRFHEVAEKCNGSEHE